MSTDIPTTVLTAEMVRNLRGGDFVWVTVDMALESNDVEAVHEIVSTLLPEDVNLLVTRGTYLKDIHMVSLEEMLAMQKIVEKAIIDHTAARTVET